MDRAGQEPGRRRGQGQLEAMVLTALHEAEEPVTAAWVRDRLGGDLAYTTVITILSRLLAKGAVTREKAGRSFAWTPSADAAGLAANRMRQLLDKENDRGTVLTRFVSGLTGEDEQLLRDLLTQSHNRSAADGAQRSGTGPGSDGARRKRD